MIERERLVLCLLVNEFVYTPPLPLGVVVGQNFYLFSVLKKET